MDVSWCCRVRRWPVSLRVSQFNSFPAYLNEKRTVRPVTKITIFGFRLGVVVLAAFWLAIFTGTHLPTAMDFSPQVNDKIKHFGAFFVLGTFLCYVTNSPHLLRRFGAIGLIGMAYAAIDEFTQGFVPGRYPDTMDFLADSAGIWTAVGIYVVGKICFEAEPQTA
jgi:VanZ family protein